MAKVPKTKFSNGQEFPLFGLGTWKSKPGEVTQAVQDAIDIGYRHFDCAHIYGNEKEVGVAIAVKIGEGVIKREDLFITSKLWNTFHRPGAVESALKITLGNLGLQYIDMYLIHWPFGFQENGFELWPKNADGKIAYSDYDYIDTWKAMEEVCKKGLTKSIGISNFNKRQIERLLVSATIVPATNQVECSPHLNQSRLLSFCKSKGITLTAYSPLGSPDRPNYKPGDPLLLNDAKLTEIGSRYNKTAAQIALRYQVQRGLITIPKSVTKSRIAENFNIFDFTLTDHDMAYMDTMDCNGRTCGFVDVKDHVHYPFADEY